MKICTLVHNSKQAWVFHAKFEVSFYLDTKNLRLNVWTAVCNSTAIQRRVFAPGHPMYSKSCWQGFPMMWAHTLSNKTNLQGWPHSHRVRITAASKRIIYSTLLMRARVTVVFYQERHEEFTALHLKVLVGQENKWLKNKNKLLQQIILLSFQDSIIETDWFSKFCSCIFKLLRMSAL